MRAYMKSAFYVSYLFCIIFVGIWLVVKSKNNKSLIFLGIACIVLGAGDAFHLIPRAIGLFSNTLDAPSQTLAAWLGVGKLVTSVTMTAFYILLYYFIFKKSGAKRKSMLDITVWGLVFLRLVLCGLPQNEWLTNSSPVLWGVIRNIPFLLMGVIVIILSFIYLKKVNYYKLLWVVIILSFAFYMPVVIWASAASWVGMLMLPKTICYLWISFMGYFDCKRNIGK